MRAYLFIISLAIVASSVRVEAAVPDTVIALDSTKSILVGNVVVSSSRWTEDSRMVPREISRVDARDIAIKNPSTTADAIAQTGVVHVQKSQLEEAPPCFVAIPQTPC